MLSPDIRQRKRKLIRRGYTKALSRKSKSEVLQGQIWTALEYTFPINFIVGGGGAHGVVVSVMPPVIHKINY